MKKLLLLFAYVACLSSPIGSSASSSSSASAAAAASSAQIKFKGAACQSTKKDAPYQKSSHGGIMSYLSSVEKMHDKYKNIPFGQFLQLTENEEKLILKRPDLSLSFLQIAFDKTNFVTILPYGRKTHY